MLPSYMKCLWNGY